MQQHVMSVPCANSKSSFIHSAGVQVKTYGQWIKRIKFAYKHTFEEWRAGAWDWNEGKLYWGEGGMEQDPFLLEEEEQAVEVTTHLTYTIAICARWTC